MEKLLEIGRLANAGDGRREELHGTRPGSRVAECTETQGAFTHQARRAAGDTAVGDEKLIQHRRDFDGSGFAPKCLAPLRHAGVRRRHQRVGRKDSGERKVHAATFAPVAVLSKLR